MLVIYTHKPESISHLFHEENEYRAAAIADAKMFHWNDKDKQKLKTAAIKFFKNKSSKKYSDVSLSLKEAEVLINQELKDLNL